MAVSYTVLLSAGIGLPESRCEGRSKGLLAIHRMHPKVSYPGFGATNLHEIVRSGVGSRRWHTLPSLTVDNKSFRSVSAKEALT